MYFPLAAINTSEFTLQLIYERAKICGTDIWFCEGLGPTDTRLKYCPPGNQAAIGENKSQPVYREKPVYSTQEK
jgi:hypothetical protein